MNPYRIYRDEWAKALAIQTTAKKYTTFVAMPFFERFSYRSHQILNKVIRAAVDGANRRGEAQRPFARPQRVAPRGASVIDDDIVQGILESHFVVADVTFENAGVLLETGIALAMKPLRQIILITQGSFDDLHFDVRNNGVICYNPKQSLAELSEAFIGAARHFEQQAAHHIVEVRKRLSPDAIAVLNWYGRIQREHGQVASLHDQQSLPTFFSGDVGRIRFHGATSELRDKDLVWTHYAVGAIPEGDAFGMHATELGWAVIENMWPVLRRPPSARRRRGGAPKRNGGGRSRRKRIEG
jgi:hypothetical protein